jgi:hypothetical protein
MRRVLAVLDGRAAFGIFADRTPVLGLQVMNSKRRSHAGCLRYVESDNPPPAGTQLRCTRRLKVDSSESGCGPPGLRFRLSPPFFIF